MRHTVVISDIHLSEVERGSGLWMRYRQRQFLPDNEIASMLGAVLGEIRAGDELTGWLPASPAGARSARGLRQKRVQCVRECLTIALTQHGRASGRHTAAAQLVHEIP